MTPIPHSDLCRALGVCDMLTAARQRYSELIMGHFVDEQITVAYGELLKAITKLYDATWEARQAHPDNGRGRG